MAVVEVERFVSSNNKFKKNALVEAHRYHFDNTKEAMFFASKIIKIDGRVVKTHIRF